MTARVLASHFIPDILIPSTKGNPMQISFTNVHGFKTVRFIHKNQIICQLFQSAYQPDFGYRLEMIQNLTLNKDGEIMMGNYHILKVFETANEGIDYIHHNFDSLIEQFNQEIAKA
jgi:hypothetical protein